MHYVTDVIANINDLDHSRRLINSLANEHNSRFAVVTRDSFLLGGDWVKDDGIYYSNTTYKPPVYVNSSWWDKPHKCDFCLEDFKYKDLKPYWNDNEKHLYHLCNDCINFVRNINSTKD